MQEEKQQREEQRRRSEPSATCPTSTKSATLSNRIHRLPSMTERRRNGRRAAGDETAG